MKVIFAGTPEFAVPTLNALIHSSHEIIAVYTQPDRPAGRGRQLTPSAVKVCALQNKLPIYQPISLKTAESQQALQDLQADVMVVVAYGLILPAAVLSIPKLGCINIHPSKLPRWRGAAPIQHTILSGDKNTAVAIMQMDKGMDTGPILLQKEIDVKPLETSGELHDRLSQVGATLLLETLENLSELQPQPQAAEGVKMASKILKSDAKIDWTLPAIDIQQAVCAYNPWPVAFTTLEGQVVRLWKAKAIEGESDSAPGTIVAAMKHGVDVVTGMGFLRITSLQLPGGKPLDAAAFCNKMQRQINIGQTCLGEEG